MTPSEMLERRQTLLQDARELHEAASGRDLTAEEQRQFDFLMSEADRMKIDASCVRMANADEVHASASAGIGIGITDRGGIAGESRALRSDESFARCCGSRGAEPGEFGEALRAAITGERRGTGQSLGEPSAGGWMVSPELSARVFDLARSKSAIIGQGAEVWPMKTSELTIAKVASDPTASWVAEKAVIPASPATFGACVLRAKKIALVVPASIELIQDAPNAGRELERLIGESIAAALDTAAINGSGAAEEPLGVLNTTGIGESAAIGAIDFGDLFDAAEAIETANNAALHLVAPAGVWSSLNRLTSGTGEFFETWPGPLKNLIRVLSNRCPSGSALMGDLSKIAIGVRQQLQVEVSRDGSYYDATAAETQNSFERGMVAIRGIVRADVGVLDASAFYALTGIS